MSQSIDPRNLKITDMRFVDIDGAPKRCTLLKLYTNQGIVGYGEVRDAYDLARNGDPNDTQSAL